MNDPNDKNSPFPNHSPGDRNVDSDSPTTPDVREITEAQYQGKPLVGTYSAKYHRAHTAHGQDHLHVFDRKNQSFAINVDGTAHDQSHQTLIPNKVAKAIADKYTQVSLPQRRFIESDQSGCGDTLVEQEEE